MRLRVYFHVAMMGEFWREIAAEVWGQIDGSGLYDDAHELTAVLTGDDCRRYVPWRGQPKWREIVTGQDVAQAYEYPTLYQLWQDAQEDPGAAYLYLHTKGASARPSPDKPCQWISRRGRDRWRRIMARHLIGDYRRAVADLSDYDTSGCWLVPAEIPHYGGNWWWARGEWLAGLPRPEPAPWGWPGGDHPRLFAELWLMSKPGGRHHEIFGGHFAFDQLYQTDTYR